MQKVAVVMLNYNMPEIIEHNVRVLKTSDVPMDIIVVENGSDEEWMFVPDDEDIHMVYLDYNLRATHGYRMGLAYVKSLEALNDEKYFAYFIMTTTGQLLNDGVDPLRALYDYLQEDENAVIIQAAHDDESIGFWEHLRNRGTGLPRRTWMMEHSCALFRADWFDEVDWLDPRLHIHGTDLYYSWQARRDGRGIYVHEGLEMHRHNNNMFELGRAPESDPSERTRLARASMEKSLSEELGQQWEQRLMQEFLEEEWM